MQYGMDHVSRNFDSALKTEETTTEETPVPPFFELNPRTGFVDGMADPETESGLDVSVNFRPHNRFEFYREKTLVNVANQEEPIYLYLFAHCFEYQMYLLNDFPAEPYGRETESASEFDSGDSQRTEFHLAFAEDSSPSTEEAAAADASVLPVKNLVVGCCVPPGTQGVFNPGEAEPEHKNGNFEVSLQDPKVFAVTTGAKDSVDAGTQKKITFQYLRPANGGGLTVTEDERGQYVTSTAKIVLSGGFVPEESPPTQEITVHLKAYLRQM